MNADGTKEGYDIGITSEISSELNIPVIASGGAGKLEHFKDVFTKGKDDAALVAYLFHYKEMEIMDLKQYLKNENIEVRI